MERVGNPARASEAEENGLPGLLCSSESGVRYPVSGRTVSGRHGASWGLPLTCPHPLVTFLPAAIFMEGGDGSDVPSASQAREVKMDAGNKEGRSLLFVRLWSSGYS